MSGGRPVALVTGATSGIGQWIALGLLRAGFRVLAVARSRARGAALQAFIGARADGAAVELLPADLASLFDVRRVAGAVRERAPQLDVLLNNAGMFARRRGLTDDGIERTLAVNHVAPFLLAQELLPALTAAGTARIVNVGSAASDSAQLDPDDLQLCRGWTPYRAYARSKLALMIATFELARRLAGSGVTANVVHPGFVNTRIGAVGGAAGLVWLLVRQFGLRPEQGADTPVYVATAPELAGQRGLYFKARKPVAPNPVALDAALAARVWAATEALAGR